MNVLIGRIWIKIHVPSFSRLLIDGTCTEQQYDMTFFSYLEQQWLHVKSMQNGIVRLVKNTNIL